MLAQAVVIVSVVLAAMPSLATAQAYPAKPIRWISPWPAGGANDIFSRAIGQKIGESLGQQVLVDNRPGAAGTIGSDIAAKAPADGYTLVMGSSPTHAIAPALYPALPYDPLRDFSAVTLVGSVPNVLVLHPSVPAKTVKEFIAVAKARPGKLNFASTGNGTSQHLSAELFKFMAGLDMVHIPYKGTAPALTELVAGQVDLAFENMPALIPHIQAGRLRALAVTTTKRSAVMPELPTIAEAALPGYDASVWFGVFAPAGTPRPVVDRLHGEILKALQTQDLKSRMVAMGTDVSGMGPDDFSAYVRKEIPKWANLVKAAGVKVSQ
ncbi:MAG TPA: tripartite tricarboxylate transporter substrate binding protein [Burkholderiales bacterium]|jgi:tripartite-type tricarboxylate transporter receptor subunit TctC|nr:tripartite tricarboxylate transporter substrate binding protein [Burkholderiales bacterium]